MYFFDNQFLAKYLEQGLDLKVYVDNEFYSIPTLDDLESPITATGYSLEGDPHIIAYSDIQQVKAGTHSLTIDQLQDKIAGTEEPQGDSGEMPMGDEPSSPDMGGAPTGKPTPASSAGGAPPPAGGGAPPEEEEEEPLPEPVTASRELFGQMLSEAKADTSDVGFSKGDLVENIDKLCEYHGSRGSVTNVDMPSKTGGIASVEYRVFNYGYNFKPGDKVVKFPNQLKKIDNNG